MVFSKTGQRFVRFFVYIFAQKWTCFLRGQKSAQKKCETFVKFVHTYLWNSDIIINVKTPQYII